MWNVVQHPVLYSAIAARLSGCLGHTSLIAGLASRLLHVILKSAKAAANYEELRPLCLCTSPLKLVVSMAWTAGHRWLLVCAGLGPTDSPQISPKELKELFRKAKDMGRPLCLACLDVSNAIVGSPKPPWCITTPRLCWRPRFPGILSHKGVGQEWPW